MNASEEIAAPGHGRDISLLPYPIYAGTQCESRLHEFFAQYRRPVIVVCDRNVIDHARRFARAIGDDIPVLPFALGEKRKHLRTVAAVLDALAAHGCDRSTIIAGVGGGVAGDLFGFAAACYMRGVGFVNIATSVVAMVDAAVGGKTGVDLPAGKNLAGVFADPAAVFAPIETLATLPQKHLREGLGEIVKHAILSGEPAFAKLELLASEPLERWPWATIVPDSIEQKAAVVREDRTEAGSRELLNLGHTFAHGYEQASSYRISHGAAVAIGLRAAGLLGMRIHGLDSAVHARVLRLLRALKLPLHATRVRTDAIMTAMAADKKARGGILRFVVPKALGAVDFGITAPAELVREIIELTLQPPTRDEFGA